MIGYLKGLLQEKTAESILLDVAGVGYHVEVPASSLCLLPSLHQETCLYIATHVREDSIRLFGFASSFDKQVFLSLINVSGVGPKVALALLGPLDGQRLCEVIATQNAKKLTSIPGVGLKTAERLILELKDKLQKLSQRSWTPLDLQTPEAHHQTWDDVKSALLNLGYKDKQIGDVVSFLQKKSDQQETFSLEWALKEALKKLSEHIFK